MRHHGIVGLAACVVVALLGPATAASAEPTIGDHADSSAILARARGAIGAPYVAGGSSPLGFDCSGFTRWVFLASGVSLPHSSAAQFALGGLSAYDRIDDRRDLEPGDLVFFRTTAAEVGHAGIYLGRGKFISSTSSSGVRVDSVYDAYYWGPRWVGAVRLPGTLGADVPGLHDRQLV